MIFVVDDIALKNIDNLIKYALENPIYLDEMIDIAEERKSPIGNNPHFQVNIIKDINVIFSLEQHKDKRFYRHLSISVRGKLPSPYIAEEIIQLFKFENPLYDCYKWIEEYSPNCHAINIMEPFTNGNNK